MREVRLDRVHQKKNSIQHHMTSPDLEPAGQEEERLTLQQLELHTEPELRQLVRVTQNRVREFKENNELYIFSKI